MKLIALEIPDDTAELAGWLEGHLVGLELSALVAELEAVHGPRKVRPSRPCHSRRSWGASAKRCSLTVWHLCREIDLRQLLRHPRLLLDFQELALSSGRPYWHRRAESTLDEDPASEQRAVIDRDWAWLTANVIEQPTRPRPSRFALRRFTRHWFLRRLDVDRRPRWCCARWFH